MKLLIVAAALLLACAAAQPQLQQRYAPMPALQRATPDAAALAAPHMDADWCALCEFVAKMGESWLKSNQTQAAVKSLLDDAAGEVCKLFKKPAAQCEAIVGAYVLPILNSVLDQQTPAVLCHELKFCSAASRDAMALAAATSADTTGLVLAESLVPEASNGTFCSLCQVAIGIAEQLLTANSTDAAIEKELDHVCTLLPGSWNSTCVSIVHTYLPELIANIKKNESPAKVCVAIHVCSPANEAMALLAVKTLLDAEDKAHAAHARATQLVRADAGAGSALVCDTCKAIVNFAEAWVADNRTMTLLESKLDGMCKLTPWDAKCEALVTEYLPTIIKFIEDHQDSTQICGEIHLCDDEEAEMVMGALVSRLVPQQHTDASGLCAVCETVINWGSQYAFSNASETKVEAFLQDDVCTILPASYGALCNATVENYVPMLFSFLQSKLNATKVCTALHLCASDIEASMLLPETYNHVCAARCELASADSSECRTCQNMMHFADIAARSQHDAAFAMHAYCVDTAANAAECEQVAYDAVAPMRAGEAPRAVCASAGACAREQNDLGKLLAIRQRATEMAFEARAPQAGGLCGVCDLVFTYAEHWIASNSTEAEITKLLEGVCGLLPANDKALCDGVVELYLPQIISFIVTKEKPAVICKQLHLCTNATVTVDEPMPALRPIGGRPPLALHRLNQAIIV